MQDENCSVLQGTFNMRLRWRWRQHIAEQRGSVSQGAWQWSRHTHNLPLVTFFTKIIVNQRHIWSKKRLTLSEKSNEQFTIPTSYVTASEQRPPVQDHRTDSLTLSNVWCHHTMFWHHHLALKSYSLLPVVQFALAWSMQLMLAA